MSITTQALSEQQEHKRDELASRLFQTCLSALDIFAVYIGDRLGLAASGSRAEFRAAAQPTRRPRR